MSPAMGPTTGERWRRLTSLFDSALSLSVGERALFVSQACSDDPVLRAELERLLVAHERSGGLERPAILAIADRAGSFDPLDARTVFGASELVVEPVQQRVGPYQLVREVGRGGMGTVYLAERVDGEFTQRVAVKLIKRGMDTDAVLQRFRAERQILASLAHPNIARLLDGGTTADGRPYVVMEYIDGAPIDRYAEERRLSIPERLRLFLRVCDAVAHAHGCQVVHRDIKPSNILVTTDGEPKLLDFGIAKVLAPETGESTTAVTGMRLLTPEYASPEQVDGRAATPSSDVYSLGVVLYELVTGQSPYGVQSRDPLSVADAVGTMDPRRPSDAAAGPATSAAREVDTLRRSLRGDLDTIILMALRKDRARRYQSVEALADDIERHLAGRPVHARPDTLRYRTGKFVRRNRTAVLSAVAVGATALALGVLLVSLRSGVVARDASRAGVLAPRDRILVADFADRAGDSSLAGALTEAFRVDLTESPLVQVLSPRQVRSTLARMERSPDLALDDSLAREVAVREGVKAFVIGSVSRVAGAYTISAQLVDAQKGDLLAAERETAADSLHVIGALGNVSRRLRARMGESMRSISATPPLEQVTTPSLSALRVYTEGTRANRAGDRRRSLDLWQHAVAIDTGFASAYRAMALTYGDAREPARAADALDHAFANQARLPFLERYLTVAARASGPFGDDYAAIAAYRTILERYPDDVRSLNNLAYLLSYHRQFDEQERLLVRAIGIDSTIPVLYTQLAMAQVNRGAMAQARRTLDEVERRFPGLFNARIAEIYLAAAQQDYEAAARHARQRLRQHPADTADALGGERAIAQILMAQGRLAESERYLRHETTMSAVAGERGDHLSAAIVLATLQLRYRHAPGDALRTVGAALARYPVDGIPEAERPWNELARFYAAAGQPARARAFLAAAARSARARQPTEQASLRWTSGVIALAEGHAGDAVPELRIASDSLDCPVCVLPDLARAYERIGAPDSAVAVYERYLRLPWEWRFETDDVELAASLMRVADLHDRRGEHARADSAYRGLVRLWRGADSTLAPLLTAARRRVVQGSIP